MSISTKAMGCSDPGTNQGSHCDYAGARPLHPKFPMEQRPLQNPSEVHCSLLSVKCL